MLPGNRDLDYILKNAQGLGELQTERIPSDVGDGLRVGWCRFPFFKTTTKTNSVSSSGRRRDL